MEKDLLRFAKNKTFVFTDLETCNLNLSFNYNRPWQCGIIKVKNNEIIGEHDLFIQLPEGMNVSSEAAKVTKFDYPNFLSKAKHPNDIFKIIYEEFDQADYIVGHNLLGYDVYLFSEWYKENKKDFRPLMPKILDTFFLYKGSKIGHTYNRDRDDLLEYMYKVLHKRVKGVKGSLSYIAKEYGINYDPNLLHDAMYDLKLNIEIWNKLKYEVEI